MFNKNNKTNENILNEENNEPNLKNVEDFLSQFSDNNTKTEVILDDFDEDNVTEDIILNEKKKFKFGKITIFSLILFLSLGLAFSAAYFLNNFKFIIGYNNIEYSNFNVGSISIISIDYKVDKNDLEVGKSILYGENEDKFERGLKEATIVKLGDQVCTVSVENNDSLILNYEKIAYILE